MAASNFEACLTLVLQYEGGYADHPKDPGGATMLGITRETYQRWTGRAVTKAEMRQLTIEDAKPIYRQQYWDAVKGDELPSGLDLAVFDFAVNSGHPRAVMALQRALGVADDGVLGPVTLQAIKKHGSEALINRLCTDRMKFLRKLKTFKVFGKGWTRRVTGVKAHALQLAKASPQAAPKFDLWAFLAALVTRKEQHP